MKRNKLKLKKNWKKKNKNSLNKLPLEARMKTMKIRNIL